MINGLNSWGSILLPPNESLQHVLSLRPGIMLPSQREEEEKEEGGGGGGEEQERFLSAEYSNVKSISWSTCR